MAQSTKTLTSFLNDPNVARYPTEVQKPNMSSCHASSPIQPAPPMPPSGQPPSPSYSSHLTCTRTIPSPHLAPHSCHLSTTPSPCHDLPLLTNPSLGSPVNTQTSLQKQSLNTEKGFFFAVNFRMLKEITPKKGTLKNFQTNTVFGPSKKIMKNFLRKFCLNL